MAFDPFTQKFLTLPSSFLNDEENWLTAHAPASNVAVSEDEKHVYVEASLPGIDPKDVDITFEKGYLWIKGEAKETEEDKKKKYYRHATRSFSYRVAVPGELDLNVEPTATQAHGVTKVTFTKAAKVQPKKIQLKAV